MQSTAVASPSPPAVRTASQRFLPWLSFILLACQLALPWTVPNFVTGDGPSHLYGASVLWELVFNHQHSIYSGLYTALKTPPLPNWSATVLLAIASEIVGTEHAEQLLASLMILAGFLAFSYAARVLSPERRPWLPTANFILQTWFLWVGFYNFYFAMVLIPALIGYYVCNAGRLNRSRAAGMALGFLAIFFTHLVGCILAIVALSIIAFWLHLFVPVMFPVAPAGPPSLRAFKPPAEGVRQFALLLAAASPSVLLTLLYAHSQPGVTPAPPRHILDVFRAFPFHTFVTGTGEVGAQSFLWPVVLAYICLAVFAMTKTEWLSAKGGLVIAAVVTFVAFLLVPDAGFGGSFVSLRFAWGVFILGALVACSVTRLRRIRLVVELYIAGCLMVNFAKTARAAQSISTAVEQYLATANRIPDNASFIRLNYAAPDLPARYGYLLTGRDPFFHLDARVAAVNNLVDVSDYEALTRTFPVVYKRVADDWRFQLWSFEGASHDSLDLVKWVSETFPRPIDFILVFGEQNSPQAIHQEMPQMLAWLDANMKLVATSKDGLLHLYRRPGFVYSQTHAPARLLPVPR